MKFYEKDWFIWVSLIFVAPLGIFLMWQQEKYKKETRIALTVIFTILFAIVVYQITSKATIVKVTQQQKVSVGQPSGTKKYQNKQEVKKTLVSANVTKESSQSTTDNSLKEILSKVPKLATDIEKASDDIVNDNYDDLKLSSQCVVDDCNQIETMPQLSLNADIQKQLKQACELYKVAYGNMYDKIKEGDTNWINQQVQNINQANSIIKNISNQINNIEGN